MELSPELVSELSAIVTVILIDIVLAGDNAVVVGLAAAGLPPKQQRQAIMIGVIVALVARLAFSLIAVQLLQVIGLVLAGGLLLLWVAWKMFRELRHGAEIKEAAAEAAAAASPQGPRKTFGSAILQIAIADISMSLDNVLAVAGAARDHMSALVIGLVFSILLMGVAAGFIARWMERLRWLAWLGFVLVLWVAVRMIWEGGHQVMDAASQAGMI